MWVDTDAEEDLLELLVDIEREEENLVGVLDAGFEDKLEEWVDEDECVDDFETA